MRSMRWKNVLAAGTALVGIHIGCTAALANDSCGTPTNISAGATSFLATTVGSTFTAGNPRNCIDRNQVDSWYVYHATATGLAVFARSSGTNPANGGMGLSAWNTCPGSLGAQQLSCGSNINSAATRLYLHVVNGQDYLIRASTYAPIATPEGTPATGTLTVSITFTADVVNAECSGALPALTGDTTVNDAGGYYSSPLPSCGIGSSTNQRALWYDYLASVDGVASIDYLSSDGSIAVFANCSGTQLACSGTAVPYWITMPIVSNQHYLIRVARPANNAPADRTLRITEFAAAENDACSTASSLMLGSNFYSNVGTVDDDAGESTGIPTCVGINSVQSSWYIFTPGTDGVATFDASLPNGHPVLVAYDACGGNVISACGLHPAGSTNTAHITAPAHAGVPIYLRVDLTDFVGGFRVFYDTGTINVGIATRPTNDSCTTPQPITPGVSSTSNNTLATGWTSENMCGTTLISGNDLWYSWTAPSSGSGMVYTCNANFANGSVVSVYTSCNGTAIGCNLQQPDNNVRPPCNESDQLLFFPVTAGTTYLIRHAGTPTYGSAGLVLLFDGINQTLPANAEVLSGNGPLTAINGTLTDQLSVKMYKIQICDEANFSASTVNAQTTSSASTVNTALYLFDSTGHGVAFNDDAGSPFDKSWLSSTLVSSNGTYYLAVTTGRPFVSTGTGSPTFNQNEYVIPRTPISGSNAIWNATPSNSERAPDGPGAAGAITGWSGFGTTSTINYRIDLSGACLVSLCAADFNGDSVRDVADLFGYINAWLAKTANADFNHDTLVDVADLFGYINAWLAGC